MTGARGGQEPVAAPRPSQSGFTMFELVVVLLVISIVLSYAFTRFADYPGAAERAHFLAVTAQLKSGLNLRMMQAVVSGDRWALEGLEGSNPMALMLDMPGNYVGEFTAVDVADLPRRVWYFDPSAGELVYLVDNRTEVYEHRDGRAVRTDRIRMRIRMIHANEPPDTRSIYRRSVAGVPGRQEDVAGSAEEVPDGRGDREGLKLQAARVYRWAGTASGS